ncbi:hypothetical protein ACFL27_28780, partial [candidate division CSSED10-310 bacterium]
VKNVSHRAYPCSFMKLIKKRSQWRNMVLSAKTFVTKILPLYNYIAQMCFITQWPWLITFQPY